MKISYEAYLDGVDDRAETLAKARAMRDEARQGHKGGKVTAADLAFYERQAEDALQALVSFQNRPDRAAT